MLLLPVLDVLTSECNLSSFDHATLKNHISAALKAILHCKGQKLNFQKKNISVSGNP